MMIRNIIVIGASAGGFEALKKIIVQFPENMEASVFIVWHMSPDVKGILAHVLNEKGNLPCTLASDGEKIEARRIYVAPPDHHLLIENEVMRLSRGTKENRFRPAIDPLFRSAAYTYGKRVIGVILSGALDDGTAGLWTIKKYGGIAVVQDPDDAEVPSMPRSAIRSVDVDFVLPVNELGIKLSHLSMEEVVDTPTTVDDKIVRRTETEIDIAMEAKSFDNNLQLGSPSTYTCPECHGVLFGIKEGNRVRYRCHTGHALSSETLLAYLGENIENSFWDVIRGLQESVMLMNELGDHFAAGNEPRIAALYFKKAQAMQQNTSLVKDAVFNFEQLDHTAIVNELPDKE